MTESPNSDSSSLRPVPGRFRKLFDRFPELRAAWDDPLVDHYLSTQSRADVVKSYLARLGLVAGGFIGYVYVQTWISRGQYIMGVAGAGVLVAAGSFLLRRTRLDLITRVPGLLGLLKSEDDREIEEWLLFPLDAERAAGLVTLEPFVQANPHFFPSYSTLVFVAALLGGLMIVLPIQTVGILAVVCLALLVVGLLPLQRYFYRYEMAKTLYFAQKYLVALHDRRTAKSYYRSWEDKGIRMKGRFLSELFVGCFYLLSVGCLIYAWLRASWPAALLAAIGLGGMWWVCRYRASKLTGFATVLYTLHRDRFQTLWTELWPRI